MLLEFNMAFVKLYSDVLMWYIIKRIIFHSQRVLNFGAASPQSLLEAWKELCVYPKAGDLYFTVRLIIFYYSASLPTTKHWLYADTLARL